MSQESKTQEQIAQEKFLKFHADFIFELISEKLTNIRVFQDGSIKITIVLTRGNTISQYQSNYLEQKMLMVVSQEETSYDMGRGITTLVYIK